jgi:hypothetical protein
MDKYRYNLTDNTDNHDNITETTDEFENMTDRNDEDNNITDINSNFTFSTNRENLIQSKNKWLNVKESIDFNFMPKL